MRVESKRAPFQVLVMPYRLHRTGFVFAALRRSDDSKWQGVAGGGNRGETPLVAARRETREELGLESKIHLIRLASLASIPVYHFAARKSWPRSTFVIYEYAFGVDCTGHKIKLSDEHNHIEWGGCRATWRKLSWQSNQTALWELSQKLGVECDVVE